jgi:hypothetical protein
MVGLDMECSLLNFSRMDFGRGKWSSMLSSRRQASDGRMIRGDPIETKIGLGWSPHVLYIGENTLCEHLEYSLLGSLEWNCDQLPDIVPIGFFSRTRHGASLPIISLSPSLLH